MNLIKKIDIKVKLSTLWIIIMFNMVFADILSLFIPWMLEELIEFAGDTPISHLMLIGAIIHQIPIFMIFLSRILNYKTNRILNITASIITIIYVIWGGSLFPHYIFIATVEVILMLYIIKISYSWREQD